jgi:hypothetical protein
MIRQGWPDVPVNKIVRPGFLRSLAASWRADQYLYSRREGRAYRDAECGTSSPADGAYTSSALTPRTPPKTHPIASGRHTSRSRGTER